MSTQYQKIEDPGAWVGPDIQQDTDWIHHLSDEEIAEIDGALSDLRANKVEIPFTANAFKIPNFSAKLDELLDELENGKGIVLIRGLPRERYSDDECALIYWGLGAHLGNPVSQNSRGHRLGHVMDEGKSYDDPTARGYQTAERMDFHSDLMPVDVLGLFCLRTAKTGGASAVISALTIHNVLREERPDLLECLYQPFNLDWRGEEPDGFKPWFTIPMFSEKDGRITSRFVSRQYYESTSRFGEELALAELQREALHAVQDIANRPELRLSMMFQEGDIQFLNNHIALHGRESFEDFDEPERRRHLLRMWIAVPDDKRRPLSDQLAERYQLVKNGGIPMKLEHSAGA